MEHDDEWDLILNYALFCYRVAPSEKSKLSPFELLYCRQPYFGSSQQSNCIDSTSLSLEEKRQNMDDLIVQRNKRYKDYLENKNANRNASVELVPGDMVMYFTRSKLSKIDPKWIGPFVVIEARGKGTVLIKSLETGIVLKAGACDVQYMDLANSNSYGSILSDELEDEIISNTGGLLPGNGILRFKLFK